MCPGSVACWLAGRPIGDFCKPTLPERMPFEGEDIKEWRKLTTDKRIKGLRAYAWASDRVAAHTLARQRAA